MDWLADSAPKLEPSNQPVASGSGVMVQTNQNQNNPNNGKNQKIQVKQKVAPKATRKKAKKKVLGANGEEIDDESPGDKSLPVNDDNVEDQMGVAETYADYKPAKLKIGVQHPDAVVETASLSSVAPTDVTYELSIPKKTIESGALSALQLESVIYASQAHTYFLEDESRAGFLIGDGAGVGKGRTVAGVIFENFQLGRKKAIWISVSNDLKYDAERDLKDIGAGHIGVHFLNKFKYSKIDSAQNGSVKSGVIFSTYSALISGTKKANAKFNTRLKQLVDWCGPNFDGCIIFDECHKAKHLIPTAGGKPTKTGMTVLELQTHLPKARVVYASATGASEPRNMAYMVRLGLWGKGTSFRNFPEFLRTLEKRGVGAMEIVALDMKLRGIYIARQLSFKGVSFTIDEIPISNEYKTTYNDSVDLWIEAKNYFSEAELLIDGNTQLKNTMWAQYWSAHQRFFKYLCIAAKVSHAVDVAKKAVEDGKCVVIGLQSTGEARTLDVIEREGGDITEFISTAKSVFQCLIENHFPAPHRSFLEDIQNSNNPQEKVKKSPSPKRRGNADLKRKVLANLDFRTRSKKPRVIYSDDSDEENGDNKTKVKSETEDSKVKIGKIKSESDFRTRSKKPQVISSDEEKKVKQCKVKMEPKDVKMKGKKRKMDADSDESSDDDDDFSGPDESDSNSDSDSNSNSNYTDNDDESDIDTPNESDFSIANSDDSDESSEYDSDMGMELVRGFGLGQSSSSKAKPMQQKIHAMLREQQQQNAANQRGLKLGQLQISYSNRACDLKDDLLEKIERLGARLPPNTLDHLIDELGGPDQVAEMTGRKGRVVHKEDNEIQYESRAEGGIGLEQMNMIEKRRFMDGDKFIAIISEAASNGISLQSDRRVANKRRRVHITLELPWSADKAIQQFGRTHRSNQVNAPEYIFLISDLAGERRFASSVAKRLESLGALTHGDRRATETRNLSQFNVENKYGREALHTVLKNIILPDNEMKKSDDKEKLLLFSEIKASLAGVGIAEGAIVLASVEMSRFLNRILGMPVDLQNTLFEYFCDTLDEIIAREKRTGKFDMGILDLGNTENAEKISSTRIMRRHATGTAPIELTTVAIERGISWEEILEKSARIQNDYEGFYMTRHTRNNNQSLCLALLVDGEKSNAQLLGIKAHHLHFQTFRPHTGAQSRFEPLDEIQRRGIKITNMERIKDLWEHHYERSAKQCMHMFWNGKCFNKNLGLECDDGMRRRKYTVLSGSIFAVWDRIEHRLREQDVIQAPRVIRLKITDGSKIIGVLVPRECVGNIVEQLLDDSENVDETFYED